MIVILTELERRLLKISIKFRQLGSGRSYVLILGLNPNNLMRFCVVWSDRSTSKKQQLRHKFVWLNRNELLPATAKQPVDMSGVTPAVG